MALLLWSVDTILFKGLNFTVDAVIIQNIHDEFKFSDVHLQDVLHLEEGPRLDFTADALLLRRPTPPTFIDAFLQEDDKEFDFTVDANAQIMPSQNYEVDAFIEQETDNDFSVDAVVVDRLNLLWDVDSIFSSRLLLEFTVDPITLGTLEQEYLLDSLLQEDDKTFDFIVDGIVDRRAPYRVDAFIRALDQELDFTVDSIIIVRKTFAFTIDADLQKPGFEPFNIDAFVELEKETDFSIDGQIIELTGEIDVCTVHFCTPTQPALFFTLDAVTVSKVDLQWNLDAHIEAQGFFDNFQVDGLLSQRHLSDFTVDASLVVLSQLNACPSLTRQSLNCVSIIRRRGT